jgi:hypothetical protein
MKISNVDTGAAILLVGSVSLYSTGHWIGGTVLLVVWMVAAVQTMV